VYWLNHDPSKCVRYDVHAVYLGTPGQDQQCPAKLTGRTETLSIASPVTFQRAAAGAAPAQPGMTGGREVRLVLALHAAIMQNDSSHQLRVATSAAVVSGTYGTDPGVVTQALATLRTAPRSAAAATARARSAAAATAHARSAAAATARARSAAAATAHARSAAPRSAAPRSAAPTRTPSPSPRARGVAWITTKSLTLQSRTMVLRDEPTPVKSNNDGEKPVTVASSAAVASPAMSAAVLRKPAAPGRAGFDACTAPSLPAMRAWRARYAVAGIYIGGSNMACDYGNLSAAWVRATTNMGWGLLPVYVGPQAPCYGYGDMIKGRVAAAQGRTAALDAASNAAAFGLPKGSPIYYDMEAYNNSKRQCVAAVLRFLTSWTRTLNGRGYISGVYSSLDSGVQDLQRAVTSAAVTEPQAIWAALWDGKRNLPGIPVLGPRPWPVSERVKQFAGGHWQKIRGVSLNIDSDVVAGPVAR
jgi:hypothetical protein